MKESYRRKIKRTQNEALQRKTGRGTFTLAFLRSIFRAHTMPFKPTNK